MSNVENRDPFHSSLFSSNTFTFLHNDDLNPLDFLFQTRLRNDFFAFLSQLCDFPKLPAVGLN